ncbi:MAG: hypothetical protein PHC88_11215 [Terrimicrobiaceae bacterium]|nr:hypothetical protein [Terrimicrobiaceae bacterium]
MSVTTRVNDPVGMGWSQCTSEGSELAELRVWTRLPLRRKLEAVEAMCDLARHFLEYRKKNGLPYIDPRTDELVRPVAGNNPD